MNCKPGDLAYIVKAPLSKDGAPIGMIVEVTEHSAVDRRFGHCWWCISRTPLETVGLGVLPACHIADDWLRPISGVPVNDDEPASVNMPEAFQLALGIEMRAWA